MAAAGARRTAGGAAALSATCPHDRDQLVLRRTCRPRPPGAGELRTWLTESHTAELFYHYPISLSALASLPQPDGAGVWADGGREIAFMLEYDTGSEHLAQLAGKLDGYARLADVMSRYHERLPLLVFCFLTPRREQTGRRALAASTDSLSLRIATAAIVPQVTCPAGQVTDAATRLRPTGSADRPGLRNS